MRLVRWLQSEFSIASKNVIGHRMVNASPFFQERVRGWRNDHTDWSRGQVRTFRKYLVRGLSRTPRPGR